MKHDRRSVASRQAAQLAISPARTTGATTLWSSPEGWRIGRHDSEHRPMLAEVLKQASDERDWGWGQANAWNLLLNLEVTVDTMTLLGSLATKLRAGRRAELTPFFAMHAARFPELVADLFPRVVEAMVLPLCGQAGVAAALRTLHSRDKDARASAAECLSDCLDAGLQFPLAALQDARQRETDRDIADQLDYVLASMRTKRIDGATRRMITARLFGDGAAPATVAEEFALPLETVLQIREQEASSRAGAGTGVS